MTGESLLGILNLPSQFGQLLLGVAFVFALVPYAAGVDLGLVRIPDVGRHGRRHLKVFGPVILIAAVLLHVPLFGMRPAVDYRQLEGRWILTDHVDERGECQTQLKSGW